MSEDGSEGTPPRPVRRKIKLMVLSSASDSDSDESVVAVSTRRKRIRVMSDDGASSSSSSGSSVVARRKRALPALRDSEADSDSSGWATDRSDAPLAAVAAAKPASGFASDSSEGNSDKCSICLLRFKEQEVGTPQTCEHIFCLDCITEWSKNVNTCPVDRMTFNSIVVRACAGGRVLRTEPVKVVERRPSVEVLVVEDPTPCEICGSTENEETMLLCDGCDLGYHMQCLTPPLTEVPIDQWLCPNCDDLMSVIHLSELDELYNDIADLDLPEGLRAHPLPEPEIVRRSTRNQSMPDEPSASSGSTGNSSFNVAPSTSRGTRAPRSSRSTNSRTTTRRRTTGTHRRKYKRRTKTVVIEYEVEENGKFPVTKTVKRRLKKRKSRKRQPRTVARRSHVRASVRAKLASMTSEQRVEAQLAGAGRGVRELGLRRQRAGIPALSLFGSPHQLDYFEEEERDTSEGATAAVAVRPTPGILNTYRQARRKMISIPSPPHASSAPDLLSSIMESQTLLHSKDAVVSVTVDGRVDITLQRRQRGGRVPAAPRAAPAGSPRLDPRSADGAARKAPAYGGGRAHGGWGGGYRGARVPPASPSAPPPRHAPPPRPAAHPPRGYDEPPPHEYGRRPPSYSPADPLYSPADPPYFRARRPENGRAPPYPRRPEPGAGPAYAPYAPPPRLPASQPPPRRQPDDPLDMRTGPPGPPPPRYGPLPEPPVFKFDQAADVDAEDEDAAGLVIDTEKYDPTEPTHDDDSGDELTPAPAPAPAPATPAQAPASAPAPAPDSAADEPPSSAVQSILAGLDTSAINVPATVLDTAVRAVLQEHRELVRPAPRDEHSDGDSDGDCPNFAIYSATSVHIASNSGLAASIPAPAPVVATPRSREDEYKEKVSKRCPITTNTRNPIKIKLNTPSLIKRQVSLYDEEDVEEEGDAVDEAEPTVDEPSADRDAVKLDETPPKNDEPVSDIPDSGEPPDDAPAINDEASCDGTAEERDKPEAVTQSPEPELEPETAVEEEEEEEHPGTPETPSVPSTPREEQRSPPAASPPPPAAEGEERTEEDGSDASPAEDHADDALEKMTESISETEDERSYTPCLDENKSKDTSLETEKEKGIEGLDTEMISEEEGNDMFSDEENRPPSERGTSPPLADDEPRRKKRDTRKEGKDKRTKAKKTDVAFKKLSKSGKERNYRDKDKERSKRERRDSGDAAERKAKRKEKRKDLERYDVRTVVTEKRKRVKDAFGRDVSPRRSPSAPRRSSSRRRSSASPRRRSISPRRRSVSPRRRSGSPRRRSISPRRKSITPRRKSISPRRKSISPRKKTISPRRRSITPRRRSISPRRRSVTPRRKSISPRRKSLSPKRKSASPRRPSAPRGRKPSPARRRRSGSRGRKRRRSTSRSPKPKSKKKKRARSERPPSRRRSPRRKSPKRTKRAKRSRSPSLSPARVPPAWSPSVASCLLSPRTPPPGPEPPPARRRRRDPERRHRRGKSGGPSKEVFTSGDNILVSVSFKDQERDRDVGEKRKRREAKRDKRRKRKRAANAAETETAKPVAIIDLERSPFREITPSPKNVIVLSDSDHGDKESERAHAAPAPAEAEHAHVGPKTPPSPAAPTPKPGAAAGEAEAEARGPSTPPDSPDAYDPFEPTASPEPAAAPPEAPAASPPRAHITLEAAQKTNLSADDVIDRRPISPIEKVMALLQSTRDVSPEPPPGDAALPPQEPPAAAPCAPAALAPAAAPRIVLPEPSRSQPPKLFLAKPSPIKSNPVKPMQATKISRLPLPATRRDEADADSPYSPGSSDFGDLFEPPGSQRPGKRDSFDSLFDKPAKGRKNKSSAAKVPVKLNKKKGNKTQVGVKIDEDNLKILDDLPSSAVEMQVKSKFLKKLNRQERVVEEVKMVLKPHYNKKHVTKDEYKEILRRCVPKICHNKSGEINPTKIQALVEAYVKKFRKKHKLGLA